MVINPNQVHNLRGRYGSLIPDTAATVQLRSAVRARKDLLTHRVGLANQLRTHLRFFHPGPVGLFADLDAVTSLRFLGRFTSQDGADWLTPSRLATWLRSVAYTGRKDAAALHAHVLAAAPGVSGPAGAAAAAVTGAFVAALTAIVAQIHALDAHIAALLASTPTHTSSCPSRAPRRCARPGYWPRSGTAAPASPPLNSSPRWPA